MKRPPPARLLLACLLLVSTPVVALAEPRVASEQVLSHCHESGVISRVSRPGPYEVGEKKVEYLESDRDGASIHLGYVKPKVPAGERIPTIVHASPYFGHNLTPEDLPWCTPRLVENFVSHGYAVAWIAVRGSSDSGGCSDMWGASERADLDQAVTWLGERTWSNGRVGMIGVSYDGSTPWEVAAMGNKYLKTVVPISGLSDIWDATYRNGVPEARGIGTFHASYYGYGFLWDNPVNGRSAQHTVEGVACPDAAERMAAAAYSQSTGERDPMGYWAERNQRPLVEKRYKGSVFMVQGLQDWNVDPSHQFPWIYELEKKGLYVKYLLGQWDHAWPDSDSDVPEVPGHEVRWDWADVLLEWWDRWLKNDLSADLGPRVEVQDSLGRWRRGRAWPPHDARRSALFLTAEGGLSEQPAKAESTVVLAGDPSRLVGGFAQSADVCPTCARFALPPSARDLRFAGIPHVDLTVVPRGPSGHVSAWLYAVDDDAATRVGWGMVDLRFPRGGETGTPVTPNEPMAVRVPIEPLDVVIPRGSSLILVLSQGGYGHADHVPSTPPFPVELKVGGKASSLILQTFSVTRRSFFTPPATPHSPN